MGVVMYTLLAGYLPFDTGFKRNIDRLFRGEVNFGPTKLYTNEMKFITKDPFKNVTQEAQILIRQMLNPDPEERISVEDALNDPWFQIFSNNNAQDNQEEEDIFDAFDSDIEE